MPILCLHGVQRYISSHTPVFTSQVVLSHTPMRQLVPKFGDLPVLVSGRGSVLKASDEGGGGWGARGSHSSLPTQPSARGASWRACDVVQKGIIDPSLPPCTGNHQLLTSPAFPLHRRVPSQVAKHYGFRHALSTYELGRAMPTVGACIQVNTYLPGTYMCEHLHV